MNKTAYTAVLAVALGFSPLSLASAAEPQANAQSDVKMTEAQCTTLWSKASGGATGDLAMDKAKPFVKDFKKADVNADSKLSATEWKDACAKGWVMGDASTGASSGTAGQDQGATSDRTPGGAKDREPGSTSAGAPGVEQGHTSSGTSDRTPSK